ncbi:antitoxin [Streptomyces sp. NPDC018019]|uniref:antitoxin n=1 Tax=Streptomyces sp. NPDC018019 TaxID=3365030 RepID=UPI0037894E9D
MGLLDNLKAKLGPLKDRAGDLAQQHGDRIEQGLDKAARAVDERTQGKYSSQIGTGAGKAKDALGRLAGESRRSDGSGGPGPQGPAA